MKKEFTFALAPMILALSLGSCDAAGAKAGSGSLRADLTPGPGWIHDFSALVKNPPQFALWIEDEAGSYAETLYVTKKAATQGWIFNGGDRRKESLPYWSHKRGVVYPDGLYLPTKDKPLTDALTGATPKAGFTLFFDPPASMTRFYICLEINHSTDFNSAYPKTAAAGTSAYSGGAEGSGQPALAYRILVDLSGDPSASRYGILGHSSPDGSDGSVDADLSGIDTALDILGDFTVRLK